jgi:hypothetical protein
METAEERRDTRVSARNHDFWRQGNVNGLSFATIIYFQFPRVGSASFSTPGNMYGLCQQVILTI